MTAKLSIKIAANPDGTQHAQVEILASDKETVLAYVALSKAVSIKLGIPISGLAAVLAASAPIADDRVTTEVVIDVGAIERAQQRRGGADAQDR